MSIINDPFGNENEAAQLGELSIENRVDQINFFGSLAITCDKVGLTRALAMKALFEDIVNKLGSLDLPESIEATPPTIGENPFA